MPLRSRYNTFYILTCPLSTLHTAKAEHSIIYKRKSTIQAGKNVLYQNHVIVLSKGLNQIQNIYSQYAYMITPRGTTPRSSRNSGQTEICDVVSGIIYIGNQIQNNCVLKIHSYYSTIQIQTA